MSFMSSSNTFDLVADGVTTIAYEESIGSSMLGATATDFLGQQPQPEAHSGDNFPLPHSDHKLPPAPAVTCPQAFEVDEVNIPSEETELVRFLFSLPPDCTLPLTSILDDFELESNNLNSTVTHHPQASSEDAPLFVNNPLLGGITHSNPIDEAEPEPVFPFHEETDWDSIYASDYYYLSAPLNGDSQPQDGTERSLAPLPPPAPAPAESESVPQLHQRPHGKAATAVILKVDVEASPPSSYESTEQKVLQPVEGVLYVSQPPSSPHPAEDTSAPAESESVPQLHQRPHGKAATAVILKVKASPCTEQKVLQPVEDVLNFPQPSPAPPPTEDTSDATTEQFQVDNWREHIVDNLGENRDTCRIGACTWEGPKSQARQHLANAHRNLIKISGYFECPRDGCTVKDCAPHTGTKTSLLATSYKKHYEDGFGKRASCKHCGTSISRCLQYDVTKHLNRCKQYGARDTSSKRKRNRENEEDDRGEGPSRKRQRK